MEGGKLSCRNSTFLGSVCDTDCEISCFLKCLVYFLTHSCFNGAFKFKCVSFDF